MGNLIFGLSSWLSWRRRWHPTIVLLPRNPMDRGAWWLQSIESRRVRHDWSDLACKVKSVFQGRKKNCIVGKGARQPEWPEGSEEHRKKREMKCEIKEKVLGGFLGFLSWKISGGVWISPALYLSLILFCSLSFSEPLRARWLLAQLPLAFHVWLFSE